MRSRTSDTKPNKSHPHDQEKGLKTINTIVYKSSIKRINENITGKHLTPSP